MLLLIVAGIAAAASASQQAQLSPRMSFFVTSKGRGLGGNFGGVTGADAHCRQLAASVGQGDKTWRAYLSAPGFGGPPVHARDRIGKGPWFNAAGARIAADLAELHGEANAIDRNSALSERGTKISPGRHDILTGSNPDGTLATDSPDATCQGWTSHDIGRAMLGHHNRSGGGQRPTSWNSAHLSRGCSQEALRASMGDALIYCFAAD